MRHGRWLVEVVACALVDTSLLCRHIVGNEGSRVEGSRHRMLEIVDGREHSIAAEANQYAADRDQRDSNGHGQVDERAEHRLLGRRLRRADFGDAIGSTRALAGTCLDRHPSQVCQMRPKSR